MDVSLSDKSAKLTQEGKIVKIFQASQMLEKARVTFIRDLLSLEEWFVRQVNFAFMDSGGPERHASELLRVLHSYGQFVALDRVISGTNQPENHLEGRIPSGLRRGGARTESRRSWKV